MKITFLGTGTSQGIPVIACGCNTCTSTDPRDNRLRASLLVEALGERLVIDVGPDFRAQMLREHVKSISGILLTHEHYDHVAGIDDLRSFNFIMRQSIHIWGEPRVLNTLKLQFPYIFEELKYPGTPDLTLHPLDENTFTVGKLKIIPIRLLHHKLPVLGFRIENMAYLTDVSYIPPKEFKKLKDLDLLIIDALRIKPHISHFNLKEALEIIKIITPKKALLTHISHTLGLYSNIEKQLPVNVQPAYDGLTIQMDL